MYKTPHKKLNMSKVTYLVRFYERANDGALSDLREEYSLHELGNTIPVPGDYIVSSGVVAGKVRSDPANRTIYEVEARYFLPTTIDENKDEYIYVVLAVQPRPGRDTEIDVLSHC